ncbi:MAG: cupin domain-containing protein [Acidimicrobiia bacterium]
MDPTDIIHRLGLEPHPEGGHYRRTFLDPEGRASSILYLLNAGERSRWHRIDGVEIWNHCGGGPLHLSVSSDVGPVERLTLGSPPDGRPQAIVSAGAWQRAEPLADHALVTCMVIPAFRWDGFELAPDGWEPGPGGVGTGPSSR